MLSGPRVTHSLTKRSSISPGIITTSAVAIGPHSFVTVTACSQLAERDHAGILLGQGARRAERPARGYTHDFEGVRLAKRTRNTEVFYFYEDKQLTAEVDVSGRVTSEYVYVGRRPVAWLGHDTSSGQGALDSLLRKHGPTDGRSRCAVSPVRRASRTGRASSCASNTRRASGCAPAWLCGRASCWAANSPFQPRVRYCRPDAGSFREWRRRPLPAFAERSFGAHIARGSF